MSASAPASASPRTERLRIAIAGATGRVGSALVAGFVAPEDAAAHVDLVALTRTPDPARLPSGVAQAAVDFDAPASLRAALEGADRLFLAQGTSPRQVENEIALVDAAVAAGVRHIVKLSALGAPVQLHPFDWHARIEAHLATRDVGYTLLRPTTFMEVLARAGQAVRAGNWGGAAGDGLVNLIDARDVADSARAVLLDPAATDWQRVFHLTGPRAWTMPQVAAELSRLLGRKVDYRHRSPDEQRAVLVGAGTSEFVAGVLVGLDRAMRESLLQEDTSTVQRLTGHAPRGLSAWLEENLASFR